MSKLWNAICSFGRWIRTHFDFALLLAAAVEIPRWTVTFLAIHEPLWVGIPLGALLAYATSEGWKAYFLDPKRHKLLAFNIASLAAATFVITPVLFSMATAPIDEIDLAALLPFGWLLAWSGVLAVTTFAPLIQLAAVKSTPAGNATETPTAQPTSNTTTPAPIATPSESGGHSEGAAQTGTAAAQPEGAQDVPTISKTKRVQQLQAEGYTASEIVSMTGITYSTVQSAMRRAITQTNGVHQ